MTAGKSEGVFQVPNGMLIKKRQVKGTVEFILIREREARCDAGGRVLDTDEKEAFLLLNVGQNIVGFIPPVSNKERVGEIGPVHHVCHGSEFILSHGLLHDSIHIDILDQVKHSVDVKEIVRLLAVDTGIEGIVAIGVRRDTQGRTVNGEDAQAVQGLVLGYTIGEVSEKTFKSLLPEL